MIFKRFTCSNLFRFTLLSVVLGTSAAHAQLSALAAQSPLNSYPSSTSTSLRAAGRILNQTTFGPTVAGIISVEQSGIPAYVDRQLNTSPYLMPLTIPQADYSTMDCSSWLCDPEKWWWENALFGQDQLRQRVAYALSKLFVVSYITVDPRYMPYYLNLLSNDAFGNWYNLMQDVAFSPAMGTYLNAANSQSSSTAHADENFGRELLQLFSVGTLALNQDGSVKIDSNFNIIPNYQPSTIQNFARAFTGLTFANDDCSTPAIPRTYFWPDPPGSSCPMVPLEQYHDQGAKTLMRGVTLPPGQSTIADFNAALQNIFNDPSLPPFVCRRLIQNLVKSNPSPQYISRIAAVFINDGSGVRGNMKAVIRAILLDSEARQDDSSNTPSATTGLMRDPILWWASVLRSLQATQNLPSPYDGIYTDVFDVWLADLGEQPRRASSVFSFYSPTYTINGGALYAPEFQLENTQTISSMILHGQDLIESHFSMPNANEFTLDLSASSPLGVIAQQQGPQGVIDALNALMMQGTMSPQMQGAILNAISGFDPATMVKNAVHLVITSPQYRIMI